MTTDTRQNILEYIAENKEVTVHQIVGHFGFTSQAIHRHLKKLVESGEVAKSGTPPRVFYHINNIVSEAAVLLPDEHGIASIIANNYIYITPDGRVLYGIEGFIEWCSRQKLNVEKTATEYIRTLEKYDKFKKNGYIDGLPKMKSVFDTVYLDEVYYLDFYSIERFGKTKIGTLVLYAKQSQNKGLIEEVARTAQLKISKLIAEKNIDALAIVPHTLPRKVQFMNELTRRLSLPLPRVNIVKVINQIPIAQKTLSKLEDRITNARSTIFVDDTKEYNNILILDDATGSGATLNETARKIREKGIVKGKIIGLTLVGSFKGFEVLNEV